MIKKVLYLILSVIGIFYIFSLSACIIYPDIATMGWFGTTLFYFAKYGGAGLVFCYCLVNFTGNIWKILLNVILIIVSILYIFIAIFPDFFRGILGI